MVGKAVEDFLANLDKPLALNEMRIMKESNYVKFRQILSDTTQYGDPILKIMKEQSLGIDSEVYDLIYESFWDLYCKKPQTPDIQPKKLEAFV